MLIERVTVRVEGLLNLCKDELCLVVVTLARVAFGYLTNAVIDALGGCHADVFTVVATRCEDVGVRIAVEQFVEGDDGQFARVLTKQ